VEAEKKALVSGHQSQKEFCDHSQAFIVMLSTSPQGNKPKFTILGQILSHHNEYSYEQQ